MLITLPLPMKPLLPVLITTIIHYQKLSPFMDCKNYFSALIITSILQAGLGWTIKNQMIYSCVYSHGTHNTKLFPYV